jgi:hypothetical protein
MVMTDNVDEVKDRLNIPEELWGCHTSVIGDYFIEGHVPVAAIEKLLAEQPDIDGIALPGMPSGAPGMTGTKQERALSTPWRTASLAGFVTI